MKNIKILGVTITNETSEKVSEYVRERIKNSSNKFFITTPNPEILVYANSHLDYLNKLNESEVALADGIGILAAAKFMGEPLRERITGVDFMEKLCKDSEENPLSMGFLGGRGGVAELTADRLKKKYPWIEIAFVGEEWPEAGLERGPAETSDQKSKQGGERGGPPSSARSEQSERGRRMGVTLNRTLPIDILFVAYGFPKQEEWIVENLEKLPVKAAMGVGGAFDYLSGKVPRAPKFLRSLGLEWLFRLIIQPWRIKRQLSLLTFLLLILKENKHQ